MRTGRNPSPPSKAKSVNEQGFADEVFRVYAHGHPEVQLTPENMKPAVAFMVERARAAALDS